jgi:Trk-type K+ transport system membrane component
LAVLGYFILDVLSRVALAYRRGRGSGPRWHDAIVLLAVVQASGEGHAAWVCFLARQGMAFLSLFGRGRGRRRLLSQLWLQPARLMVASFAAAVVVGAVLLNLPMASTAGRSIGLVDSVFTATSAVCVTGLTVKDTGADFTLFGQLVILVLIQLGGLGIATFSVSIALTVGRALSQSQVVIMQDVLDEQSAREVLALIQFITLATLVIETVGAAVLFYRFGAHGGYTLATLYSAVFHAISAFGTVGLSAGATAKLTVAGRLIIAALMFVGRIGPLTLTLSLVGETRPVDYRYPDTRIMVG